MFGVIVREHRSPRNSMVAAQIAAATCAGAVVPQLGALSGARWAHLLRGERAGELPAAFSLESLADATAFLLGPVLVASLGAAGDAAPASAIAAGLILGGGLALAAQRRTAPRPARGRAGQARTGRTLLRPAFLLLALLNLAIGLYFGTMAVAVSSFAAGHGVPGAAAPIIAASSLSGLLSGWVYGLRRHRAPARRQLVVATAYLDEADRAGQVVVLDQGRVLVVGTPAGVVGAVLGVVREAGSAPDARFRRTAWRRGGRWRIWCPSGAGPGVPVEPDLPDAVVVAALAKEIRDE